MNELKHEDVMRALELKVQRHLMPNVDIDGTVSVEDAERWFLKLLKEELAPYVSALLREKDALIEDYRQELGRARVALNDANVEIERLKAENAVYVNGVEKVAENYHRQGRAEAITEFANRMKASLNDVARWQMHGVEDEYFIIGKSLIDQIAKEMKEVEQ